MPTSLVETSEKKNGGNKLLPFISILVFFSLLLPAFFIGSGSTLSAEDNCKNIEDDDDRLECYEKKEQETRNKLNSTRDKISSTQNTISSLHPYI